jgi:hypothetical protein
LEAVGVVQGVESTSRIDLLTLEPFCLGLGCSPPIPLEPQLSRAGAEDVGAVRTAFGSVGMARQSAINRTSGAGRFRLLELRRSARAHGGASFYVAKSMIEPAQLL